MSKEKEKVFKNFKSGLVNLTLCCKAIDSIKKEISDTSLLTQITNLEALIDISIHDFELFFNNLEKILGG